MDKTTTIVTVAIVALVGFAGWMIYSLQKQLAADEMKIANMQNQTRKGDIIGGILGFFGL